MKLESIRKEIIDQYLSGEVGGYFYLKKNGKVNIYGNVQIIFQKGSVLPFKIGTVYGDFIIHNCNLLNLDNFPDQIEGFCVAWNNSKIFTEEIREKCKVRFDVVTDNNRQFKYNIPTDRHRKIGKIIENYNKIPS